ncbi:MAG: nucleotidyltransferase domain-containing protein [Campylobacterota bacterium]|nr:nucleotidyltransferase domain-containing protein [Campylobacterota bacterium]
MLIYQDFMIEKLSHLKPKLIIIFGSYAKNTYHSRSDIDIAFYSDIKIDNYQRWLLAQNIAMGLNIDVDLVDIQSANDVLKFEIASTGKVILNKNMDSFLDRCYTSYFVLNEDRKEILEYYDR